MTFDQKNMGEDVKESFKSCGQDTVIYELAKIVKPELVECGDHTRIDDFVFLNGGAGTKIGRYVHIASFVCIIGGGELVIGDYVGIANSSTIITGTDDYHGGKRMTAALPEEFRHVIRGKVVLEKDCFIGSNSVIHPNVTVGEGAIIGSNSLVVKDVEPWTINVGSPCKIIGKRPKLTVHDI
jgi:acetyltransferase-like isoleucine patch superfamily enzyme